MPPKEGVGGKSKQWTGIDIVMCIFECNVY